MQTTIPSRVLTGAVLPRSAVVTTTLVIGFALLTALAAQIVIPLPFTPVPITGQTFVVLLAGAGLGATAGAASQGLYVLLGAVGLPFYAGGASGWTVARGATGGYLIGFIVAAWIVGALAERRQDRSVLTAIPAFLFGSVLIHLFGVPWLAATLDVGWMEAASLGSVPFIPGDLVKIALAGLLLPAAWKLASAADRRS
ncbi:MAG TPA: biotin transporter BioY [Acidimicrobiia bacterium]|nr:biotin transporter BioY [Acidimicrobiia bacterium]